MFIFYILSYILIPVALVMMVRNYRTTNWLWAGFMLISIPVGIAPFIAAAYLAVASQAPQKTVKATSNGVTYNPDGTYTVYKIDSTQNAPTPGRTAFRVIGGIIAGASIAFGLLIVGVILLFTLAPSVACGGSSKCM